jgi:hypothetical protein
MNLWLVLGIAIVLVLIVFGLYLSNTAGRLDHLHRRIDTSTLALDAQLLRRSSVSLELAASQLLDPASSMLLADAAHEARTSTDRPLEERALAESDLTAALLATLDDEGQAEVAAAPEGGALLDELDAACRRVELSRRFHNDAVRACRQLRQQRMARVFRLAGHTPWPESFEMDDTMPGRPPAH